MSKASKLLDLKIAQKRLDEFKSSGAPQPGMFSVMEEAIKQAPFEQAPGLEWQKYIRPGRMVTRGGVSFPLKQTEFDILGIEDIDKDLGLEMFLSNRDVYTKEDVLKIIREERPEFAITVAKQEFNPLTGTFYTPPDPEVLPKQWLQAGARGEITPEGVFKDLEDIKIQSVKHGQTDVSGGSKLSHRSPFSSYEESVTRLPGIVDYPSHYGRDTIVWSRASTHPETDIGRVRLVEEIQSDINKAANEKIYIDDTNYEMYTRGEIPSGFLDEAGEPILGAGDLRVEKRGYNDVFADLDMDEWRVELNELGKNIKNHDRREFLRGTDLEHVVGDKVYTPVQYAEAKDRHKYLLHLIERGKLRVSDTPFKKPQEYGSLELRKQLMNAVDDDADYLALTTGRDQIERFGPGGPGGKREIGLSHKYDKIYRGELEKLARRYSAQIEDVTIKVGTGPDVRPSTMQQLGVDDIDGLHEYIQTGIEESSDVQSAAFSAQDYGAFADEMDQLIHAHPHISNDLGATLIRRIKDNADLMSEKINILWEGAASGDQDGVFKWMTELQPLEGKIANDMEKLYERYLRHLGTAGTRNKTFPAIKLTPEVKDLIREIGVPLAKNEDPKEGEPEMVMAALGGLVRRYERGGPVRMTEEELTPEEWKEFHSNVEAQRAAYDEEKAQKNAKLAARWEEGDVREDSGLIKYLKSITRSLAGAVPGIGPDTRQWISDTMRHVPSGIASQWQSLDPETGEASFVVPISQLPPEVLHYGGMDREEYDEANAVIAAHNAKFRPNIIDETKMIPGIPGMFWPETFGEPPQYAVEAMERSEEVQKQILEEMEIGRPEGFIQGASQGLGIMLGQVPVPGAALKGIAGDVAARAAGPTATALALTIPKGVKTAAKAVTLPPRAAMEFFNPFVTPRWSSYMMGAGFGGTLAKGAELLGGEEGEPPSPETFEQEQIIRQNKARVTDEWAGLESFENRMDVVSDPQVGNVIWYWLSDEDKNAFVEEVHTRGLMSDEEYQDYMDRKPESFSKGGYIKKLIKLRKGVIDAEDLFADVRRRIREEGPREKILERDPGEGDIEEIRQLVEEGRMDLGDLDEGEEIIELTDKGRELLDDPYDPDTIKTVSTEHLPPTPEFLDWLEDFGKRLDEKIALREAKVAEMDFKYEPGDTVMGTLYRHEILFKDVDKKGRPTYRVRNLDEGGEYDLREEGIMGKFEGPKEVIPTRQMDEMAADAASDFEEFTGFYPEDLELLGEPIGEGMWEVKVTMADGEYRFVYDINESDPRDRFFEMVRDDDWE